MFFTILIVVALVVMLTLSWSAVPKEHRKSVVWGDLGVVILAVLLGAFVGAAVGIRVFF